MAGDGIGGGEGMSSNHKWRRGRFRIIGSGSARGRGVEVNKWEMLKLRGRTTGEKWGMGRGRKGGGEVGVGGREGERGKGVGVRREESEECTPVGEGGRWEGRGGGQERGGGGGEGWGVLER